jgi:parvulin-like peptidyl-prolyl isomerase
MKLILASLLLTFTLNSFAQDADPVVAEVNGKKIKQSTLKNYHEQNLKFVRSDKKVTIEKSLNDLVDRMIGIESAKKSNLHKRPDLIKKMNDVIYHAYVSDELTPLLKKIKKITDKDIKSYYKKFPEYRTSQILLRVRAVPSKEELAGQLKKANEIYSSIQADSKSFEKLALQYGQTSTSQAGGDLGYQAKARLSQEYFEAIHGKKVGSLVKPFRSQYGIHIVKVTGVKKYEQIDKKLYEKVVYDTKRDAILAKYFAGKRKASKIKVYKNNLKL